MSQYDQAPQPRRRRSERYNTKGAPRQEEQQAPQRAGFPSDETAPMPLGGYDAARPPAGRDTRSVPQVYEESDYHPPRRNPVTPGQPVYDEYYDDEDLPPRRWPAVLLAVVVLAAGLFAASYFLIPREATGILGQARSVSAGVIDGGLGLLGVRKPEPPRLIKFDTPEYVVQAGVKTVFTFTADKPISGIRILDEVGTEIKGVPEAIDLSNTTWTLTAILDEPLTSTLSAGILVDKTWYQTDKTIQLTVAVPSPIPEPVAPAPTGLAEEAQAAQDAMAGLEEGTETFTEDLPQAQAADAGTMAPASVIFDSMMPAFTPAPTSEETSQPGAAFQVALPEATAAIPADTPPEDAADTGESAEMLEGAGMASDYAEEPAEGQAAENPEGLPQDEPANQDSAAEQAAAEQAAGEPAATPAPTATLMPALTLAASEQASPERLGITEAAYLGSKRQDGYQRAEPLNAQGGGNYTFYEGGVFAFRGGAMRQNAAFGTAGMPLNQLSIRWQSELGSLRTADGTLYGVGWTGQPAIVKWTTQARGVMNLNSDKKDVKALKEVIVAGLDGKVYFVDLADGLPTREAIDTGYPLKSSVAVDAMGRPLVAFGQAVSKMPGKTGDIGFHFYNLIDSSEAHFINGRKTKNQVQYSTNGAFDGSGLFDRFSDAFVVAGENGLLYTVKMNTVFDFRNPESLTVDPEIIYLRSKGKQQDNSVSIESSPAMYGPYAFYADKQGILRAVDTTSMKTVWAFDTGDNTDATPALDLGDDQSLALYTGTTVFARTRGRDAVATLRRLDALTGQEAWSFSVSAKYDNLERGGLKASPLIGQGQIANLVIFTVNLTEEGGAIIALDKQTGQQVWKLPLPAGAVSSPVAVYREDGSANIVQADLDGRLHLIEGGTGQVLNTLDLGGPVEGSPAVYNDVLVIATAGKDNSRLYGIRLE